MTTLDAKVAGDVGDTCVVILQDDGTPVDLTTATGVEAHVWQSGGTPADLTAAVTSAAAGQITVQLGGAAGWLATVATPGTWLLEYEVTFSPTNVRTWPSGPPDQFTVRTQGS